MRSRVRAGVLLIGCTGVLVAALGAAAVAAKPSAKKVQLNCTATAYGVDFPKLSGLAFAQLNCTKPFGAGVQQARNTTAIVGSTVNVSGSFKNFFDDGTDSGTVKMSGPFGTGAITVKGSVTTARGTGAYKHINGKGSVTCTTADAGKTFHCTVKGTVTL
jgi:hypothetical protein